METSLKPVDSSPAVGIGIGESTTSEDTETELKVSTYTPRIG